MAAVPKSSRRSSRDGARRLVQHELRARVEQQDEREAPEHGVGIAAMPQHIMQVAVCRRAQAHQEVEIGRIAAYQGNRQDGGAPRVRGQTALHILQPRRSPRR